jgi:hypothetical protein
MSLILLREKDLVSEDSFVCDRKLCSRPATHIVTVHQIDTCTEQPPIGNRVYLNCYWCGKDTVRRVNGIVARMRKALPQQALWLECTSCGLVIHTAADAASMVRGIRV